MGIATLWLGWVWLQRHDSYARNPRSMAAGRGAAQTLPWEDGGSAVRITQFYARAGEMVDGEQNLVCYGVQNARSVRIEPPVESLTPARTRCFFVEPHKDTTYRLVTEGIDGSLAAESFEIHVKPAPPEIRMFAVSEKKIVRGDPVTLCYGVAHARAVRLDPDGWDLAPVTQNCARIYPKATGTFTLVATGVDGRTEQKKFSVAVK